MKWATMLTLGGKQILRNHRVESYQRDITNPVRVFPKLSEEHFQLTPGIRMRNHPAFDVLGERMLELVTVKNVN